MKVVINRQFGGFCLSHEAIMRYSELTGLNLLVFNKDAKLYGADYYRDGIEDDDHYWLDHHIERNCPHLVQVVEEFGTEANGWAANLQIVEIPDDVEWEIHEYDGIESIHEKHRVWP